MKLALELYLIFILVCMAHPAHGMLPWVSADEVITSWLRHSLQKETQFKGWVKCWGEDAWVRDWV